MSDEEKGMESSQEMGSCYVPQERKMPVAETETERIFGLGVYSGERLMTDTERHCVPGIRLRHTVGRGTGPR